MIDLNWTDGYLWLPVNVTAGGPGVLNAHLRQTDFDLCFLEKLRCGPISEENFQVCRENLPQVFAFQMLFSLLLPTATGQLREFGFSADTFRQGLGIF